ncbi:spore coat protein [Paenibacillus arenosi]|uniref:Spore coat protein n=1 Tax=Paenibacillus arenosi TaxID=2774142 RepID=A0ABR9AW25_9BACL|nr:spore coat protein [Paenibacillus arenosi]MBD8497869.1 spore coat protein [Paenibacillus arenosi]
MRFFIRWLRMLAAFIVISVITSLLTIGTTALVVDQYLQTTIQQFQLPIEKKPLTAMSLWSSLWNGAKLEQPIGDIETRENAQSNEQPPNRAKAQQGIMREQQLPGGRSGNEAEAPNTSGAGAQNGSTSDADAAMPVWGGSMNESAESGNRVLVTPEAIVEGKDKLTEQTKEKLFSTLMKKLPADDWQRISTLMEEGLTATELIEMEQILAKHLNDEEYKQMREILTGSSKQTQQAQANEGSTNNSSTNSREDTELQ